MYPYTVPSVNIVIYSVCVQENVYPYIVPSVLGIIHVALTGSVYTTIAVAVERCVTVCAPFTSIKVFAV